MKITKTKLKQIIKEEIESVSSNPEPEKGKESPPVPGEVAGGTFEDGLRWSIDEDGGVFLEDDDPGSYFPDRIYIKPDQLKRLYDIVSRL